MSIPPDINNSTREQREAYIKHRFRCISNCALCGNCVVLHGREADDAYAEYINGQKSFVEVSRSLNSQ